MKCRLVQEAWVPFNDAVYDRVGNILLSRVMGADVELVEAGFDIGIRESWERALEDVKSQFCLALFLVRTVTIETIFREDVSRLHGQFHIRVCR